MKELKPLRRLYYDSDTMTPKQRKELRKVNRTIMWKNSTTMKRNRKILKKTLPEPNVFSDER